MQFGVFVIFCVFITLLTAYLDKRKIAQNIEYAANQSKRKKAWREANPEKARVDDIMAERSKKLVEEYNRNPQTIDMNAVLVKFHADRAAAAAEEAKNKALAEAIAKAMRERR